MCRRREEDTTRLLMNENGVRDGRRLFGRLFVLSESRFRGIIHKRCVSFDQEAFSCFLVLYC